MEEKKRKKKKKDRFEEVLEELKKYEEGTPPRSAQDLTCQCGHDH